MLVVTGDVQNPDSATELVNQTADRFGRLDSIVVNAGLRGGADEAVYAATKFAQVGLSSALDREVRSEGIRVTTICPAGVHTEFAIGAGRTEGDRALDDYLQPEDVAHAIATVPREPRRVRPTQWQLWSMGQSS